MNNLWRGIVCIKYRGALKRHARASGAQRAITLRSRNARKCARESICFVREVSWNTKLCARYEEVIRKSNFFFFTLLIFKKFRVCTWPINNSKLFHLKERLMTIIHGYRTSENPTFSLFRNLTGITCTHGRLNSKFLHLKSECLAVNRLRMLKERNILLLLLEKRYTNIFFLFFIFMINSVSTRGRFNSKFFHLKR